MTDVRRLTYLVYFLGTISLLSLGLNIVLVLERSDPDLISTLRLAFKRVPPVTANDHIRGSSDASMTVIEYSDFLCKFCKQMHAGLKTLEESGRIRWVFRNKPLDSVHPLATKAAIAAECAGQQDKFWEYADSLFNEQDQITLQEAFTELGHQLKLDSAKFARCQDSNVSDLVRDQSQQAEALEVSSTPTSFFNGKRYVGALSLEEMSGIVDRK